MIKIFDDYIENQKKFKEELKDSDYKSGGFNRGNKKNPHLDTMKDLM